MRALLLSALALSLVAFSPSALAAEAGCAGWVCDTVRAVCGGPCVSLDAAAPDADASCSGGLCDAINKVCGGCIPQAAAVEAAPMTEARCPGELCDAINAVCWVVWREPCVY